MKLSADFIAQLTQASALPSSVAEATGVSFHSGRVKRGDVFFALAGEASHGIHFADDVLAKGAAFLVSDRPHPKAILVEDSAKALLALGKQARTELSCPIIAVTGSAGKTSTKSFLSTALNAASTVGNFNTPFALAKTLIEHSLKMPNKPLVLELGIDHVGEMATLVDLVKPTHGILTSIGASHLAGLGSLEQVAKEKAAMFVADIPAFVSEQALAFVTPYIKNPISYGLSDTLDYSGQLISDQSLSYKGFDLNLPSPGEAMANNAVAALAMADYFELPLKEVLQRLSNTQLEPGRLEFKQQGDLTIIDDSYNSNPLSAEQSLALLRKQAQPQAAILGDMLELGSASRQYHLELGKLTKGLATYAIGRESIAILESNPKAKHFLTVDAFLAKLPEFSSGTVLVKASRGMHLEQVVDALLGVTA